MPRERILCARLGLRRRRRGTRNRGRWTRTRHWLYFYRVNNGIDKLLVGSAFERLLPRPLGLCRQPAATCCQSPPTAVSAGVQTSFVCSTRASAPSADLTGESTSVRTCQYREILLKSDSAGSIDSSGLKEPANGQSQIASDSLSIQIQSLGP